MQVLIYVTYRSAISALTETSSMTSADAQSTTSTSIAPLMTARVSGLVALSVMGAYCAAVENVPALSSPESSVAVWRNLAIWRLGLINQVVLAPRAPFSVYRLESFGLFVSAYFRRDEFAAFEHLP
jgi:hypothetical protein